MMNISVLVCDDSALMRKLISKIIDSADDMSVVGTAMNGEFALQKIPRLNPDIIILDLEMPQMNGIEFLKERRKRKIDIPVVILSSIARRGAQITMDALNYGASDFIMKPSGAISENIQVIGDHIIETVRAYAEEYKRRQRSEKTAPVRQDESVKAAEIIEKIRRKKVAEEISSVPEAPYILKTIKPAAPLNPHKGPIDVVAIGISTGGPNALRKVLSNISGKWKVPILIVQHMPAGFTFEFAKSLDRICTLDVKEAEEGDVIKPGRVFIAPGNKHVIIKKKPLANIIHLSDNAQVNGHRPSVDVLFASVAEVYESKSIAVIMTGMGKDGAKEIGSVAKAGGLTIGQDEESSIVYGMPRVACEYGHLHHVISLQEIANKMSDFIKEFNSEGE